MGNKLERFPALAFIQLTVANDAEHPIRPPRQLMRQRHSAGDGNPLSQRAGSGVHPARFQPVRVAWQPRTVLV